MSQGEARLLKLTGGRCTSEPPPRFREHLSRGLGGDSASPADTPQLCLRVPNSGRAHGRVWLGCTEMGLPRGGLGTGLPRHPTPRSQEAPKAPPPRCCHFQFWWLSTDSFLSALSPARDVLGGEMLDFDRPASVAEAPQKLRVRANHRRAGRSDHGAPGLMGDNYPLSRIAKRKQ